MRRRTTTKKISKQADIIAGLGDGLQLSCDWQVVSDRQAWHLGRDDRGWRPCLTRPCVALELSGRIRKVSELGDSNERHQVWVLTREGD